MIEQSFWTNIFDMRRKYIGINWTELGDKFKLKL